MPPAPETDERIEYDRLIFKGGEYDDLFAVVDTTTGDVVYTLEHLRPEGVSNCESAGMLSANVLLILCDIVDDSDEMLYADTIEPTEIPLDVPAVPHD